MTASNNYQILVTKLDAFIRKYYLNQLLRGGLYWIGLSLVAFLVVNLLESQFYFTRDVRKLMFFGFVGTSLLSLVTWVLVPLLHYLRLGKLISHEQAASIIGDHFGDVKDKLLNVLQLKKQADSALDTDLLLAGINQKSEEIKIVPFQSAIDLTKNRKYLRYALPPFALLLILLFAAPSLIKDSAFRLLRNNTDFVKPAPFSFVLQNKELKAVENADFPITVKVEGETLPNELYVSVDNYQYRMTKENATTFTYNIANVQKSMDLKFSAGDISSKNYTLEVLRRPNITHFDVKLDYPAYVGRIDETIANVGDLIVPAGTNISWLFEALNTDKFELVFAGEAPMEAKRGDEKTFAYVKRAVKDQAYQIFVSNKQLPNPDSVRYSITVVPDLYPTVSVERFVDSTNKKMVFFAGDVADDYGISRLTFNYRISRKGQQGKMESVPLAKPAGKAGTYAHQFNINTLALEPGDEVTYFIEVWDNDGVKGAKSARTNLMTYEMPTIEEFKEKEKENDKDIKKNLEDALKESKKLQKELKKQREKLLQKKEMTWEDRKELEKLMDRQKDLQKEIEAAKEKMMENMKNQQEFSKTEEKIQEKQEKIEKLMQEAMSEEMKDLMKQIEELMQELKKDEALEKMEDMEMNDEELEMELDKMLELFKQLEFERDMERMLEELEKLAEKEEKLAEKTEKMDEKTPPSEKEAAKEEQEKLNKEFEEKQKEMKELEKKNEELERPKDMGVPEEEMKDIEEDMEKSSEEMEQNQSKKASKSQKKAADKMKKMAGKMKQKMQNQEMEQMEEDMKALRQLLENLVGLSFEQESLMKEFGITQINTPRYVTLTQKQFKLKDDFKLVEDTLHALAKRVVQIESFVTEKVIEVKSNMKQSIDDLEERLVAQGLEHQQYTMKNLNDLALMLSETMQNMQQQMAGMMSGNQMCNNPGGQGKSGKTPSDKMGEGQKGLKNQMQKMKEGMEKGQGGSSKEFAEMAAKQAALRNALRKKQQELQQKGKGEGGALQDIIDQMNKVETDLVNKKLTNEMMKRQEDIITKLLEHEKAEREREYDDQRKSRTAENMPPKAPPALEEYLKKKQSEVDLYKTVSPALRPYYKQLVEQYYQDLRSGGK